MIVETNALYLEHHGIEGMSWGVRNGPPYPLSPQARLTVYKQAESDKLAKRETKLEKAHSRKAFKMRDKKYEERKSTIKMEKSAIKNMTVEQMDYEQGKAKTAAVLNVAGTVAVDIALKAVGAPVIWLPSPKAAAQNAKTDARAAFEVDRKLSK